MFGFLNNNKKRKEIELIFIYLNIIMYYFNFLFGFLNNNKKKKEIELIFIYLNIINIFYLINLFSLAF